MTDSFSASEVPAVRGYTIEWVDPAGFILSRRNRLYACDSLTGPRTALAAFPPDTRWHGVVAQFRLGQRLLRYFFYNVLRLSEDRIFVTFQKQVGLFERGEFVPVGGLVRPCRVLRGACSVDAEGGVYFGEYLSNKERGPIRIYRLAPGSRELTVVHEFPAGSVRHVHGLYRDPFDDSMWALTGDREHECGMWRTTDGFESLELVGGGDETWRAVSVLFRERAIYYGMDAEFRQNYLFKLDRRTRTRTRLTEVDGPVYYSAAVGGQLFFGVTAEGCPSQRENRARLFRLDAADAASEVFSYPKDWLPNSLMPGTLHFPQGPVDAGTLYCYCLGLAAMDGRTVAIRRP